jgi:uncharacterized protein
VTRRLTVTWPDSRPFASRDGAPIRLLAVSDDVDPALEHAVNREALGHLDAIVGCGDLEPSYLGYLADAFGVEIAFVRGNHDRGGHWVETAGRAPSPLESGRLASIGGITLVPFEWPGVDRPRAPRDEWRAWLDVLRAERHLLGRRLLGRSGPILVISHAPPRGLGDVAADPYHVGYTGYRWFLERHHPPVWLHGHTTPAAVLDWRATLGSSMVANATGSIVLELVPGATGPLAGS